METPRQVLSHTSPAAAIAMGRAMQKAAHGNAELRREGRELERRGFVAARAGHLFPVQKSPTDIVDPSPDRLG